MAVLEPELARALVSDRHAIATLGVGAGEVRELIEVVDRAGRRDLGDAEPADAEPPDRKVIGLAAEFQRPAAEIAAADEGDLHLLDPDGPGRLEIVGGAGA